MWTAIAKRLTGGFIIVIKTGLESALLGTNKDKRPKEKGVNAMAYFSGLRPEIYHVCKNCHVGNNIEPRNLREGQPRQAKLCETCAELQSEGKCVLGIPVPAR